MNLFDRFKKLIACVILTAFIPSQAWAQGINIPPSSSLNLNTGTLTVPGSIVNSGAISSTTGTINLTGNWTNSGTITPGTGTVNFNGTSGQVINTGGTATTDAFYNLTHPSSSALSLISHDILIDNNFTNTGGSFVTNNFNMTVDDNWDNTATFTAGTGTVTLAGGDQEVLGSTSFYDFSKVVSSGGPDTLTFDHTGTQDFTNSLIMQGNASNNLNIRSTTNGVQANIALTAGHNQSISYVDVKDSNASGGAQLIARTSPDHSNFATYDNTNWAFGNATVTWIGVTSSEWQDVTNWDKGIVPAPGDTVVIQPLSVSVLHEPDLCPSTHINPCADTSVGNLTIQASASLSLSGKNLTVALISPAVGVFTNSGTVFLHGNETLTLTQDTTDHGTFNYQGTGTGATNTLLTSYYNLVFNDTNGTKDTFVTSAATTIVGDMTATSVNTITTNGALTVDGNATITAGTLDISTHANPLTVGGTLAIGASGVLTATASNITANGALSIASGGTFTAPGTGKTFTVSGNWTNNGGNYVAVSHTTGFNNSSGLVTFNGGDQSVIGSTTFYQFNKTVAVSHTLTFDHTGLQTFTNSLTLLGATGQQLLIRSDLVGTQANIVLLSGAGVTQNISDVNVQYSNAGSLPTDATLIARNTSTDAAPGNTNTNWSFGGATYTWTGATSTEWNVATNWNQGTIPSTTGVDSIVIPSTSITNFPDLCPSTHTNPCTAVDVANLTLNTGSSLTLTGQNLTVASTLANSGNLILEGSETVALTQDTTNHGTFTYIGDGSGNPITIKDFGTNDYYNLTINDAHSGGSAPNLPDTYKIASSSALHVVGALTLTKASLDLSGGTADVDGDVTIATGSTLKAPASTSSTAFTVGGNWSNSGTFTADSGLVTFDGGDQSVLGTTTFYQFNKTVTVAHTLTFGHTGSQTFSNMLTLAGANASQLLSIASDLAGTPAPIGLTAGGTQVINFVSVADSNAAAGVSLVARNSPDHSAGSFHNTNWQFGAATLNWKGGSGTGSTLTDWNVATNWDAGLVPIAGDNVIIPGGTTYEPVLSTAVNIGTLTVGQGASASTATLTLNGFNLSVVTTGGAANTFNNLGTVILDGNEQVTLIMDSTHGTFDYVGDGNATQDTRTLSICSSISPVTCSGTITYNNLTINDPNATVAHRDIFDLNGTVTINTGSALTVTSGTLDASTNSSSIIDNGSVTINGGTLTAPGSASTFNVAANWANTSGTFNSNTGTVNFITTGTSVISGSTSFYNFNSTAAGKTITVTAGTTQTVTHTFLLKGATGNYITFHSTAAPWNLTLSAVQSVSGVDVEGSDASKTVTCLDCVNSGNNTNWVFETLALNVPSNGRTVGPTPTLIGTGPFNTDISIYDSTNHLVATTTTDANGSFRVVVGQDKDSLSTTTIPAGTQLAAGANSLTLYITSTLTPALPSTSITVVASPTTDQVPTIVTPANNAQLAGPEPTVTGKGLANQPVTIEAITYQGANQVVSIVATGTTDASGNYSIKLTTPLPALTNFLSVTVGTSGTAGNSTASALTEVMMTDPFGTVFDSSTDLPITVATVTLYRSDKHIAQASTCDSNGNITVQRDLACTDVNPFTTGPASSNGMPGLYTFLAVPGNYYMTVSAPGYTYPTKLTTLPTDRSLIAGDKGDVFTVGSVISQIDQPLDGNGMLLRITKTANKSEASVGDIVLYTVNIQNVSPNPVTQILLNDEIPPGFKYVKDRVLLNSSATSEPAGQRPLVFSVGNIGIGATDILQYQLVIGSGVTMGNYQNTAEARYASGLVISNPAEASVKIVPDPVFDLGSVIGKVFFDWNENGIQDPPYYDSVSHETIVEKPVPNVQIVMEDGTIITTDRDGKFNIPGLLPGRHLFRLDERTLPPGAYLTTDKAVIDDVTAGSISKVNFGVNIDESQTKSRDAVFFNEKIRLTQDRNRPVPRLNAALFDASVNAKPGTEEIVFNGGSLVRKAEFRIFTNYSPFIGTWHLDIMDADTRKIIKSFTGTALNISDPIYWDGHDDHDTIVDPDHHYSYVLGVVDAKNNRDDTKEKPITVRKLIEQVDIKKELDESKEALKDRADRYRKWLDDQTAVNNLDHQLIPIQGETIHLDRQGTDVRSIKVMKGNQLFTDIPLTKQYGLTPAELVAGGFSMTDEQDNLEIILPNGDYSLDVVSVKASDKDKEAVMPAVPVVPTEVSGMPSRTETAPVSGPLEHYSRPLKVGDDYMMFVAMGDAQVGYNIDRGHLEPIQDATEEPGFYHEGKGAYYLKGQILGKYLITSSYDSDRAQKALFRQLDPNVYYPVYGDSSTINYDATDTQGALYLKVDWDKSSAILGNYAVDFNDTEFSAFSRDYYGGKIDYQSVASNPYGDARTKIVVYHAQVQQLPSHNEFLATGGSLYFLKYRNVVQGSDKITIEVRDQTTGLALSSQAMVNGADYELDNSQGRILFWQPVAMIAQSNSVISNSLVSGNPIYVVIDYQYAVTGMQVQGAQGARVAQSIGDNLVLGGTYIQDNSSGQQYSLQGTDATLHLNKDTTIKAEYAESQSQEQGNYVSTDGGITFSLLNLDNGTSVNGKAYGISGDARLFDNIGLKSYYKWVGSDFGATQADSQQGTEKMGLSITWDMTPVTRVTASEDIQRLLAGGNLQTSAQIGASETDTTMIQIVHTAERLKLTGQFQLTEVKSIVNGIESTTNQRGATMAGQAQYDLTPRIKITLGQQVDVMNAANTATTLGVADRVTDRTTTNVQEVFGAQGHALTAGVTNQLTKKFALTTDYTLTNLNTGEVDKTVTIGAEDQVNNKLTATGSVAQTASSVGTSTTTASVGAKTKLSDNTSMDVGIGKSQNSDGQQSTSLTMNGNAQIDKNTTLTATTAVSNGTTVTDALGIGTTGVTTTSVGLIATRNGENSTQTNASVNLSDDTTGAKTTTLGFGNTAKIDQELQAVTNNSFSFSPENGTTDDSKYGIVRNTGGHNLEADYTRQLANQPANTSQSNIYGLTGDVNDNLALNGSIEQGKVQNLDTSQTLRTDFTVGAGYVLKDTATAVERLKNSLKLELRLDRGIGTDSLHQYVLFDAFDGKATDNLSFTAKVDYSKTLDTTTGAVAERHKEIILGMAYRPVSFDNLNFITEYSYQDGYGGGTQQADALNTNVEQTIAQVFSAEGVYDINDQWQAAEKIAYRIESEQDTGFDFTQTHTWLVIHRLNYKIDRNWTISGEYRDLVQVEAKDSKQGIMLEATRDINQNTQLAIGWNFTKYSDDLTDLSYTSLGPFVRMTGKFYDRTPEEKARDRAKYLDIRINEWAWTMIRKELSKKDSKIVLELNRLFVMAKAAQKAGRLEESRQMYKDIIAAGQMMYDEASEYIRGRIAIEEQLQQLDRTARDYFRGGEYVKARKIWEKVVEDASKGGKINSK